MSENIPRKAWTLLRALLLIPMLTTALSCSGQVASLQAGELATSAATRVVVSAASLQLAEAPSRTQEPRTQVSPAQTTDLWVDANTGNDANSGLSQGQAFRSIQRAADVAGPGTTVHLLPGVYREAVTPAQSGIATAPILYLAENGPGSVLVRGSQASSSLTWAPLTTNSIGLPARVNPKNVYYTDLSAWGLSEAPRFVVQLDSSGNVVARLEPAREPDWMVETEWKVHEYWWMANGGSAVAGCDPARDPDPNCDLPWRSTTQLTDNRSDSAPADIEPGNLTMLGNLAGATLVAMDALNGHYVYRRTITAHDVGAGRVSVDKACDHDSGGGLGWGSKYYVENHPALLDQPGEWWYDANSGRLYLWAPGGVSPARLDLEISRRGNGFDLTDRSYVGLEGLTIELYNDAAYRIYNEGSWLRAVGDSVRHSTLRYANVGVLLYQWVGGEEPEGYAIESFALEDSEVAYMDTSGMDSGSWWPEAPDPAQFSQAGVRNTLVRHNELHHLGFRSEERSAVGMRFYFPERLSLEGNHLHHVAHSGVHLFLSLVDSPNQYGFSPDEIRLGQILVWGNLFEQTCQMASDCGAFKIGGNDRPYTHVFRDVLITENVFRNTFGWSYVSVQRGGSTLGNGNGFYLDRASGIHAYRNIAYNNTGAGFKLTCLWRDGDIVYYNNIAANNSKGFHFTDDDSSACDNHQGSVNTQVVNNILINNDAYGLEFSATYTDGTYGNLTIDHNLYYSNGWNEGADIRLFQGSLPAQYFHGLAEIQAGTPWEDHGVEGDPDFLAYDPADHDLYDGSWPDFHLTPASLTPRDQGTVALPASLSALLTLFGVPDKSLGSAFDIGRYEAAGAIGVPASQSISPGATAPFTVSMYPPSFPLPLALSAACPGPDLVCEPESSLLGPGVTIALSVTDLHDPAATLSSGVLYTITLSVVYGASTQSTSVNLLVGGERQYLPLCTRANSWKGVGNESTAAAPNIR